ncbi:hypothetical protein Q5530_30295 [Saccharothrix sp. BKS2]|uniref:hypothetical protein n=1 Tax=Saccharothrix sp. BKS2 TaxID=3064400 RepID=UPI0039E85B57
MVRPTPPRPLDSGPTFPPIAHPNPDGAPTAPTRHRTSTAPGPIAKPVPVVRWTSDTVVQRTRNGPETTTPQRQPQQQPTPQHPVNAPGHQPTPPHSATHPATPPRTEERGDDGRPAVPLDLDDLARRLLEPVGRLLRAELRQGRERAGRLHDRRR